MITLEAKIALKKTDLRIHNIAIIAAKPANSPTAFPLSRVLALAEVGAVVEPVVVELPVVVAPVVAGLVLLLVDEVDVDVVLIVVVSVPPPGVVVVSVMKVPVDVPVVTVGLKCKTSSSDYYSETQL